MSVRSYYIAHRAFDHTGCSTCLLILSYLSVLPSYVGLALNSMMRAENEL
jgi:hypothetical protein